MITRHRVDPSVHLPAFGWATLAFLFSITIILTAFSHNSHADSSGVYAASNVIGEFNALGGAYSNFIEPTNQTGMGPNDIVVDATNHRLIIDDGSNSRILIYSLDSNNNLVSTAPNYVLGQPDLTTFTNGYGNQPVTASTISCSSSMAFDQVNDRLFIADQCDSRVLVFNFAGGISNGMNASYVLGEPDFTTSYSHGNGETDTQTDIRDPSGLAYDTASQQLFVADYNGNRILTFDLSSGISNGMNASHVLGEPNFTTQQNNLSPVINASLTLDPNGVTYDSVNKLLYVSDAQQDLNASIVGGRLLVFNITGGITDGMAASNVLGQPNFTSDTYALTQSGMRNPGHLLLDAANSLLFVSDSGNDRDIVFNVSGGVTDGMNASNVLGEPNFTTSNPNDATRSGTVYSGPNGFGYDQGNERLYVSDSGSRILTLNLSSGVSNDMSPTSVLGQTDFAGNPTYTSTGFNDEGHYMKQWVDIPAGTYVDSVRHLLYVADNSFGRVMVYPLSNENILAPGQAASYVLGQPDFISTAEGPQPDTTSTWTDNPTQSTLPCPQGITGDPSRNLLFVYDCNNRVLVFDTTNGLSNGMNASYVIGQTNFTNTTGGATQNTFSQPSGSIGFNNGGGGITYDPTTRYLYVGDSNNFRVMVFDTSSLSNGMNASYVIGQPDFTSSAAAISQSGLDSVEGLTVDTQNHELFVADNSGTRVLVYNTTALANGMNASNVLGEPNFTTGATFPVPWTAHTMYPQGLSFDQRHHRLFVEDSLDRVLVFDLSSGITNDMDATGVLGQPNLTADMFNSSPAPTPSKYTLYTPGGSSDAYDPTSDQLYVTVLYDGRVMAYSFAHLNAINSTANIGDTYNRVLGSGVQGTTSYALLSGSLPTGLTLNLSSGLLSGTVLASGVYNFTVRITDNNGPPGTYTDTRAYTVTVPGNSSSSGSNITSSDSSGLNSANNTNATETSVRGNTSNNKNLSNTGLDIIWILSMSYVITIIALAIRVWRHRSSTLSFVYRSG